MMDLSPLYHAIAAVVLQCTVGLAFCMWLVLSASMRRAQRSEKLIAEITERLDKAGL